MRLIINWSITWWWWACGRKSKLDPVNLVGLIWWWACGRKSITNRANLVGPLGWWACGRKSIMNPVNPCWVTWVVDLRSQIHTEPIQPFLAHLCGGLAVANPY